MSSSNHGKGIALTTGFFGVLAFVIIICTALPLAVSTSKNINNSKVKEASGYAWAAFVFEITSVILISVAMYLYYQCVNADQARTDIWNTRYDTQTTMLKAGAASVQQGVSNVSKKAFAPSDIPSDITSSDITSSDITISDPSGFGRGTENLWATKVDSDILQKSGIPLPLDESSTYPVSTDTRSLPTAPPKQYGEIYTP